MCVCIYKEYIYIYISYADSRDSFDFFSCYPSLSVIACGSLLNGTQCPYFSTSLLIILLGL